MRKKDAVIVSVYSRDYYDIALYNPSGAVVMNARGFGPKQAEIPVHNLSAGVYVARYRIGKQMLTERIAVRR